MTTSACKPEIRIAIAGGGCAGCSLAVELLARVPSAAITIFEPQLTPPLDKTWCSWETRTHRFTKAVSTRWTRVAVRSQDSEAIVDASSYPYACVRARDFYSLVDRELSVSNCSVRRGTGVESMSEHADAVDLILRNPDQSHSRETFAMVFDARPPDHHGTEHPREPMLLQHFGGVELTVTDPTFDQSIATLMDFDVPQHEGTHFMYVLPFARNRILVESTFLSPGLTHPINYEANALLYARTKLGITSADIIYRESGVLPMTLRPLGPASTPRIWRIGARAGIARPSSGYAFDAIQRDSAHIVDALLAGHPRPLPPRPGLVNLLDRVLLSLLDADPAAATRIFPRLFRNAPPQRLIRFLADSPSAADYASVMWAMPKAEVIRHILTHATAWPRTRT